MDAALELAKSEGWENVSIRKIAKKIGFSTMKIYSDFGSKERLFFDIQKIGFKLLKETYFSAIENIDDPKLKLESIFLSHV
ncbi:MAG: helix-turn-helix domain-containing protein, partial [Bacteroidota bacterium]